MELAAGGELEELEVGVGGHDRQGMAPLSQSNIMKRTDNNNNNTADDIGITADEWIQLALREYEQIASLCNAQSTLGNSASAAAASTAAVTTTTLPLSAPINEEEADDDCHRPGNNELHDLDPKYLTMELQRRDLHDRTTDYYRGVDAVRKTHPSLKAHLSQWCDDDDGKCNDGNDHEGRRLLANSSRRMRTLPVGEAFSRHIELSERVIRTVMMMMMMQSSSARHNNNGGGACGVLFENGMVRSSSAGAREVNIVALASLRGSVSQLKANCGGSCS